MEGGEESALEVLKLDFFLLFFPEKKREIQIEKKEREELWGGKKRHKLIF